MKLDAGIKEFEYACRARGVGTVTWRFYGPKLDVMRDYLKTEFDIESVEGIRPSHVNRFVNYLRETPALNGRGVRSSHTIKAYVEAIKVFLSWAVDEDLVAQQVNDRIEMPRVSKKVIKTLSRDQFDRLMSATRHEITRTLQLRAPAILCVLLDTGIRAEELCALEYGHLRDDHLFIAKGKGSKEREVGPLGQETQKYLRRYLRGQDRAPSDRLFLGRRREPLTPSGLDRMIYRLRDLAGPHYFEGIRVSAHTFRHTYAVNYMKQGGDIYTLSLLLGHSSVAVTQNYLRDFKQKEARRGSSVLDTF